MMTSPSDTEQIERYILGDLSPEEGLVFHARLLTDPLLCLRVRLQKKTYKLVRAYARKKVKAEMEAVHQELFLDPAKATFHQKILQFFNH